MSTSEKRQESKFQKVCETIIAIGTALVGCVTLIRDVDKDTSIQTGWDKDLY